LAFLRNPPSLTPRALASRERRLGPLGNHLGLMLGDRCQDVDGKPVRLREIDRRELDARLHDLSGTMSGTFQKKSRPG
jgi:hypothetical protein